MASTSLIMILSLTVIYRYPKCWQNLRGFYSCRSSHANKKYITVKLAYELGYSLKVIFGAQDTILRFKAKSQSSVVGYTSNKYAAAKYYWTWYPCMCFILTVKKEVHSGMHWKITSAFNHFVLPSQKPLPLSTRASGKQQTNPVQS